MSLSLKGKVVLITGASSGFGMDSALMFASEGASVILVARRMERLQATMERIHEAGGIAMAIPADINNPSEIQNMVESVIANFGCVDILFNNAGFGSLNWFDKLDSERGIRTQVNVNLTGLMEVTHAVLPYMIAKQSGHIINMSSVAGWIAAPMYSVYAATKFGVRGFTDSLRREVRIYNIHVSGIYPGPAHTEFGEHTGKRSLKNSFEFPEWVYITSKYVAQRVLDVAKHPRRSLIIPWWFHPVIWIDYRFPGFVDWILHRFFVEKYRITQ